MGIKSLIAKNGLKKGSQNIVKEATKKSASVVGSAMSVGMPLYFGMQEYKAAREEGNSMLMSGARAVGDFAVSEMMGMGYLGLQLAPLIPKGAVGLAESLNSMSRSMNQAAVAGPFSNATFNDTQQTYTMRQAGMQLAQASKYNLQQTLMGNEAQYLKY